MLVLKVCSVYHSFTRPAAVCTRWHGDSINDEMDYNKRRDLSVLVVYLS